MTLTAAADLGTGSNGVQDEGPRVLPPPRLPFPDCLHERVESGVLAEGHPSCYEQGRQPGSTSTLQQCTPVDHDRDQRCIRVSRPYAARKRWPFDAALQMPPH
jgi:hypothetical protein